MQLSWELWLRPGDTVEDFDRSRGRGLVNQLLEATACLTEHDYCHFFEPHLPLRKLSWPYLIILISYFTVRDSLCEPEEVLRST